MSVSDPSGRLASPNSTSERLLGHSSYSCKRKSEGTQKMTTRTVFLSCLLAALVVGAACSKANQGANNQKVAAKPNATPPQVPTALPDEAFKAQITFVSPPAK